MATTLLVVKNRAHSKLAAALTIGGTTLTVTAGHGARFPSTYPFHLTIDDEIVSCTARSTDSLTIVRAQQGTSAAVHGNKAYVALHITAKSITDLNTAVNTLEDSRLDDVVFTFGTDGDIGMVSRSTILNANTALTGVLVGTPVAQAIAANSLMIANVTASGDIALYVNKGGHSQMVFWADGSTGDTAIMAASGQSVDHYIAGTKVLDHASGAFAFQESTTISSTGTLTINAVTLGGTLDAAGNLLTNLGTIQSRAGDNNLVILARRAFANQGVALFLQTYNASNVASSRLTFTGGYDTAVAAWAAVTHTGFVASGVVNITPAAAANSHLIISGTAKLNANEQALYINFPSETVATNGIWITLGSTVTSGDLTGIRSRVTGNATSSGANVRGAYLEAKVGAGKYAAMLEGALIHADYSAIGAGTISGDVRGLTVQISQGTGLTAANLYGILLNIQTRGDENITTNDVGLMIRNEAVGGNGRTMDAAIKIADLNMGGGTNGFTDDIVFHKTSHIRDETGYLTIYGTAGHVRIGDANTTQHSLASEDDLMVTGKLEVNGTFYPNAQTLGGTITLNGQVFDAGSGGLEITTTGALQYLTFKTSGADHHGGRLKLYNYQSSPSARQAGGLEFASTDSNLNETAYGTLLCTIINKTDGAEEAKYDWYLQNGGSSGLAMSLSGAGLVSLKDGGAINTGLVDSDYFTLGAVDNDTNVITELARATGAAQPSLDLLLARFGTSALAADAAHRGMFYFTEGGAGVADLLYCIMKGADNNYSAVQVAVG